MSKVQSLIFALLVSTCWLGHMQSHFKAKQYTEVCFWKHLRCKIGSAVTKSQFTFDQHCLVWLSNWSLAAGHIAMDGPHLQKVEAKSWLCKFTYSECSCRRAVSIMHHAARSPALHRKAMGCVTTWHPLLDLVCLYHKCSSDVCSWISDT